MCKTALVGLSVFCALGVLGGCNSTESRGKSALFNFQPVESPNPAISSGVVERRDGLDSYSYTVPRRKVMWLSNGAHYTDYGSSYDNAYNGSGYQEGYRAYENEYPARYFLSPRHEPVFHDGGELLGLDVQSAERIVSPDGETVDVRVRISAPTLKSAQRDGNHFAIVLDASSSMQEPEKIKLLKSAGHYLIDQIFPGDRVSLVILGTKMSIPLRTNEPVDPAALHRLIDELRPDGRGMLATGLDEAYAQMEDLLRESGEAGHVVLVTDGKAGRGGTGAWRFVNMALRRHARQGVRLSVVGVGMRMDAPFLSELARAGDGRFAYLQTEAEVNQVLGRELETMLRVYARNVRLRIRNPEGGQVLSVHGLEFPTPREGVDEIALSDFVPGEQRSLLLRIQFPPTTKPAKLFNTNLQLFFERVSPRRRNTIERSVSVRTGAKTGNVSTNRVVDVYSRLIFGMEQIRLALDSRSEAAAAAIRQVLEKELPGLREDAIKSADRDVLHHAQLFEYFARRLSELALEGKLQGASSERDALRKELYYRRYPVRST